jgi:hypothetical protein
MRGCELLWDITKAAEIQARVEEAIDGPCPCRVGNACPLLPDLNVALVQRAPLAEAV